MRETSEEFTLNIASITWSIESQLFNKKFYIKSFQNEVCVSIFWPRSRLEKMGSAVRETTVSRHNGVPIKGTTLIPQYDSAVMVRGLGGLSICLSWCWEALFSRTAFVCCFFSSLIPDNETFHVTLGLCFFFILYIL